MSLRVGGTRIARRVAKQIEIPVAILPAFLCPGILKIGPASPSTRCLQSQRQLHMTEASQMKPKAKWDDSLKVSRPLLSVLTPTLLAKLPVQCPGCGALSQTVESMEPGFYTLTRKSMREYFQGNTRHKRSREGKIFENSVIALEQSQEATEEQKGIVRELSSAFAETNEQFISSKPIEPPMCDRCHHLKHYQKGVYTHQYTHQSSVHHPSIQSLEDTIFESPYKYNHIYHIIDAADFPMSLVQGLHKLLHLTPQRSLNRRSQTGKFYHGRKTEVSFIITRSDLLGPTKQHVDKLMPYLRSVLRDALGRAAQDARLGNVRCVSAKQQWWTKELKEEIWNRGGGGWMVGKVNVGKSQLFQEVFPKGRMGDWGKHTTLSTATGLQKGFPRKLAAQEEMLEPVMEQLEPVPTEVSSQPSESVQTAIQESELRTLDREPAPVEEIESVSAPIEPRTSEPQLLEIEDASPIKRSDEIDPSVELLDTTSLLPPLPAEIEYPAMPLASPVPGTTASPIRIPFGNGKGELIDLPGLSRGDLEVHVEPKHRYSLLMRKPVSDTRQKVLKPGKSLLLSGFIRITPTTPDIYFIADNFTPLEPHMTSTEKAIGIQSGTSDANVLNIAAEGTESKIKSAGKFYLKWDVTKERTGPLTRKDAAGIKVERLPFRVLGLDILIEGVGWVELAAQIRKPYGYQTKQDSLDYEAEKENGIDPTWPEIEVFTPEGKFVGQRRPMNASLMLEDKPGSKDGKARPRKAMKGAKKAGKVRARMPSSPI